MKQSKVRRKYVNAMDSMADVPKSARQFKYPPTYKETTVPGICNAISGVGWKRRRGPIGLIRAPKATAERRCGAQLIIRHGRIICPTCEALNREVTVVRVARALDHPIEALNRATRRRYWRISLARERDVPPELLMRVRAAVARPPRWAGLYAARAKQATAGRIFSRRKV